jgi:hypothetical protein
VDAGGVVVVVEVVVVLESSSAHARLEAARTTQKVAVCRSFVFMGCVLAYAVPRPDLPHLSR